MTIGLILAFLLGGMQLGLGSQAAKQGREGNGHLKTEAFEEASTAFQKGLNTYSGDSQLDDYYYGLQHNLGVSLFRQEDYEQAQAAFDAALTNAPTASERARASYNAGNNAFQSQAAEAALAYYRDALLANPDSDDAKFNYEFVRRWMQQQENQQQQDDEEQDDQEQEQNQDQESQQGQQQENEPQPNEEQQQQDQPQQEPGEETESDGQPQQANDMQLTREQAEQILEALENEEQELLRQVQKVQGRRRNVVKDW